MNDAVVIALLLLFGAWRAHKFWKSRFVVGSAEWERRYETDQNTVEVAPWFGKTGLAETDERELPRYLRREFGEMLSDWGSLRASDLVYLGIQTDAVGTAHWWGIPEGGSSNIDSYACVDIDEHGNATSMEWGSREPPRKVPE